MSSSILHVRPRLPAYVSRRGLALEPMLGVMASSLAWPRKGCDQQGHDGQPDEMQNLERLMCAIVSHSK